MDKCFKNKFVTVAEHRFVLIHVGSVDVHFAAILEQTVCAECVRVGEMCLIVTVLQDDEYLHGCNINIFIQITLSQLQLHNCKDKE